MNMLTTEAEAKTKRCQESFGDSNIGTGFTQQQALPPGAFAFTPMATVPVTTSPYHCIGSACMAWRWGRLINVYDPTMIEGEFTVRQELGGYCGKAGKPVQIDMKDAT